MTSQTRLSAFKILKEVARISLIAPESGLSFPAEFCHRMASEKINLLFLSCCSHNGGWGLNTAVGSDNAEKALDLIMEDFGQVICRSSKSGILSLFPHRHNPSVTGSLLNVLGKKSIEPEALAHSNSAISVILREDVIGKATSALFEPFQFSAYRTPADWKLAQKGKEQLFKEVVASYQEKRPKVYNLEWQKDLNLFKIRLNNRDLNIIGKAFDSLAQQGFFLPFLTSSPSDEQQAWNLFLCISDNAQKGVYDLVKGLLPDVVTANMPPVAVFSMNGPHFGDRHGIASELLRAFDEANIDLLALGCAIASISGVVPADQLRIATQAIEKCFDVPSVIIKEKTTL